MPSSLSIPGNLETSRHVHTLYSDNIVLSTSIALPILHAIRQGVTEWAVLIGYFQFPGSLVREQRDWYTLLCMPSSLSIPGNLETSRHVHTLYSDNIVLSTSIALPILHAIRQGVTEWAVLIGYFQFCARSNHTQIWCTLS